MISEDIDDIVEKWKESCFENSPKGALEYLRYRMYVKRDIKPLNANGTQIKIKAEAYWSYRNGIIDVTVRDLKYYAKYTGNEVRPEAIRYAKRKYKENVRNTITLGKSKE